jgi:predicted transcriptional regulator
MTERQLLEILFKGRDAIGPALDLMRQGKTADIELALRPLLEAVGKYISQNTRICERVDCKGLFLKMSARRKQFFCSERCAHVVAVRKHRRRKGITSGHTAKGAAA